jgi:hypothetical protein
MALTILVLVVVLYLLFITTVLRLAARMVAGINPTFGSAVGAFLTSIVGAFFAGCFIAILTFGHFDARSIAYPAAFVVQAIVYSLMLRDRHGAGIDFLQSVLVILCQIPFAVAIGGLVGLVLFASGIAFSSLIPNNLLASIPNSISSLVRPSASSARPRQLDLFNQVFPSATPAAKTVRWATLSTHVTVATKYGSVTYAPGTPVQLVSETPAGYLARLHGNDLALSRQQLVISSR